MGEPARDEVDRLVSLLRQVDVRLPDTERSRGAARLVERLAQEAGPPAARKAAHGTWPRWSWAAAGGVLIAAAGVLVALSKWPGLDGAVKQLPPPDVVPEHSAPSGEGTQGFSSGLAARPSNLAILYPYSSRPASQGQTARGAGLAWLESPGPGQRSAWLSDCGRIALHGPGKVQVRPSGAGNIVLHLERGMLLVSFDHTGDRSLTIQTKDAEVQVTGTIFAVWAGDGATLVSVWRGSLEVAATGLPVSVTQGKSWRVGAARLGSLEGPSERALREFVRADKSKSPAPAVAPQARGAIGNQADTLAARTATPIEEPVPAGAPSASAPPDIARPETAEELYRKAEQALAAGRVEEGERFLDRIVTAHADDPLLGPAEYELGRLAFAGRDFGEARQRLARVRDSQRAASARFHEPAAFLICKCEVELGRSSVAAACFERYLADFRDAPHAAEALAFLAAQLLREHGCGQALPVLDAYLERFPGEAYAREARVARDRCRSAWTPR